MSGIAGILNTDGSPVRSDDLEKMAEAIRHRGPDGIKFFKHGNVGLVHLFLRIDETTFQPISENGVTMVLDGRIDNLDLLRRVVAGDRWQAVGGNDSLEPQLGDSCRLSPAASSPSDARHSPLATRNRRTEAVLLAAYLKFGLDLPKWLLGDFALAVWDERLKRLLLARDQIGVKPLFYYRDESRLIFASEAKAILAVPAVPCEADETRLAEHLRYRFRGPERTFFRGIKRVVPGEMLRADAGRIRRRGFGTLLGSDQTQGTDGRSLTTRFRRLFEEAVASRLPSEGTAVCFLSGGLDSSSIAGVAAAEIRRRSWPVTLHTLTMGIDGVVQSRSYVSAVCDMWGLGNSIVQIAPFDPRDLVRGGVYQTETPMVDVDDIAFQTQVLPHVGSRVALLGHWGDQLMLSMAYVGDLLRDGRPWSFLVELLALRRKDWATVPQALRRAVRYISFPNSTGPILHSCALRELYGSIFATYNTLLLEINEMAAAANGLELRYPFLDLELIRLVFLMPTDQRVRQGLGKLLIRNGLKDLLPDSVLHRLDKDEFAPSWQSILRSVGLEGQTWQASLERGRWMSQRVWKDVWLKGEWA